MSKISSERFVTIPPKPIHRETEQKNTDTSVRNIRSDQPRVPVDKNPPTIPYTKNRANRSRRKTQKHRTIQEAGNHTPSNYHQVTRW